MASIFRTATKQAILEILEEAGTKNRFGLHITEEGIDRATDRVVDLFEMTLQLRSQTQDIRSLLSQAVQPSPEAKGGGAKAQAASPTREPALKTRQALVSEDGPFPRTRTAAEIYAMDTFAPGTPKADPFAGPLPAQHDFKLPRQKVTMTAEELQKLKN